MTVDVLQFLPPRRKKTDAERKEAKRAYDARRRAECNAERVAKKSESAKAYRSRVRAASQPPTADRVRQLLDYDHESGLFTWRERPNGRVPVGAVAGAVAKNGYVVLNIDARQYKTHRLAWLYVYGEWPVGVIDHIDHDKTNNAISNLRDVSYATNSQNMVRALRNNQAGLLGVYPHRDKWGARILANGKRRFLGYFGAPLEAYAAYLSAKRELHQGNTL